MLPARKADQLPANQAGYEPEALDAALGRQVNQCGRTAHSVEVIARQVHAALENVQAAQAGANALQEADRMVTLFERLTRAQLSQVKATDELTRLRSFLAGGPDSRPDLSRKGELELIAMILQTAKALGWTITKDGAPVIEGEVIDG